MQRFLRKRSVQYATILFCLAAFLCYFLLFREVSETGLARDLKPDLNIEIEARLRTLERSLQQNKQLLENVKAKVDLISSYIDRRQLPESSNITASEVFCSPKKYNQSYSDTVENMYTILKFDDPDGGVWKQGWNIVVNESKFSKEKLKVFVVPHSHNDPGWIKTFDQYFLTQSRNILNNMLKRLSENSKLSFIWAETSFFAAWWETLTSEDEREMVKTLLDNGQLEIVNGGWVMNDEANTHYFAIISQMVYGHEWLKENLNYTPRHGWAIDPFGLSSTMAFLLKRMGFKAMVIQRVHYALKKHLAKHLLLEFNWKQYWETNEAESILCHIEPFYSYDIPHTCGPDPKICCQYDFKRLPPTRLSCPWKSPPQKITNKNVKQRAATLLDQYKKKSMLYRTTSLLVPLGDDFRFDKLAEWDNQVKNYQRLFDEMNSHPQWNVEIKFATLADYFDSLDFSQLTLPAVGGDFFTYADRQDNYWSGFYTTRPFYKRLDRILEAYVRSADILFSLASILSNRLESSESLARLLNYARQNLALFQHHDGITGTAKDHVVKDYANRMLLSIRKSQGVISNLSAAFLHSSKNSIIRFSERFTTAYSLPLKEIINITAEQNRWTIIAFNSLAITREELLCVVMSANTSNWIVRDSQGKLITSVQINSIWNYEKQEENLIEACFLALLKPVSLTHFVIEKTSSSSHFYQPSHVDLYNFDTNVQSETPQELEISSEHLILRFSGADGMLRKVVRYLEGAPLLTNNVRAQFMTYGTRKGKKTEKSGAYLFLPDSDAAQDLHYGRPKIRVTKGPLISKVEVMVTRPIRVYHKVSLIKNRKSFDMETDIYMEKGKLDNKELILRIYTDLKNEGSFYTDLNGLQMVRRQWYDKIPLQGNVYPMASLMYIEDGRTRFNVLTAQPLGTTSMHPGFVDIFLDRRLLQDDQRGVNQGITDNKLTKENFRIVLEGKQFEESKQSFMVNSESLKLMNPVSVMYSSEQNAQGETEFVSSKWPCDVHLVNLRSSLGSSSEFALFLHRIGMSCGSECRENQPLKLAELFSPSVVGQIVPYVSRHSLSLMHEYERNVSLFNNIVIKPMDFQVYNLRLK